jgi:hypothetical protein
MIINERDLRINPNTTKVDQEIDKFKINTLRKGTYTVTKGSQIRLDIYTEKLHNEIRGLK